jgi:hypothetical protein
MICKHRHIFQAIKQRRMEWVGYGARTGQRRGLFRVLEGNPVQRHHSEDLGMDRMIIQVGSKKNMLGGRGLNCCGSRPSKLLSILSMAMDFQDP